MKTKFASLLIIAVLLLGSFHVLFASASSSSSPSVNKTPDRQPVGSPDDLTGTDGTARLSTFVVEGLRRDTGNTWTVPVIDDYYGGVYYLDFECIIQGTHGNIWVGLSPDDWDGYYDEFVDNPGLDDDVWYFAYPWSITGLGLMPPGYRDYIYGSQLQYLLDEFDDNIWEKTTEFFGLYNDRPGPFGDYKVQILIFNIRDEFFYSPYTADSFIEGYFWQAVSNVMDANIFHMDSYQWWRRVGPDPGPPYPYGYLTYRPFEYEGTFAHEFQHLIHRDIDSDEISWVNEGCSMLSEYVCGYPLSPGHLQQYFQWFWDTSLVVWEDYLSNYGIVLLWTLYMYEHYGGHQFIYDVVHEQANGIEGYNNVLAAHGYKKDFDQVFEDWAIANYLDDTSFAKGIYGYYALDIPSSATDWWSIPYSVWVLGCYDEMYWTGWILPERLPYIAWYWELYNGAPELKGYFDGDDFAGVFPSSGMYEWYSDGTPYSWFRLEQTFGIPSGGATLKFWSNYDIEENWDYGYVEVHDLATNEWYTLQGTNTVSSLPNPQDNPNCPNGTDPNAHEPQEYSDAGRWNAFTGNSGGWYQEEIDLAAFAGHNVEIYFTYWTDPYTLGLGWYIDDVEIPEIGFFDDAETGADGWTTNAGWSITTGVVENDFRVNVIETMTLMTRKGTTTIYNISPMTLDDAAEDGQELIDVIDTARVQTGPAVLVMASQPGYEHTFATEFLFLVEDPPFGFIHYWTH